MLLSCRGRPGAPAHTQAIWYGKLALSQDVEGCPPLCMQLHCCCSSLVPPPEWKLDALQSLQSAWDLSRLATSLSHMCWCTPLLACMLPLLPLLDLPLWAAAGHQLCTVPGS